jgi:hypothetical protein
MLTARTANSCAMHQLGHAATQTETAWQPLLEEAGAGSWLQEARHC